jgi:hypothetical protein
MVADDMATAGRAHELVDGPAVLPMNPAVGITEETDVHIGLVDGKEAVHSVLEPDNLSVSDPNYGVAEQLVPESRFCICAQVCIDHPAWVVLLNQVKVLKEPSVV